MVWLTRKCRLPSSSCDWKPHGVLPGGRTEIALFHYAIDGLMLDHLTVPLDTGVSVDAAINEFVDRILR